jgi:hypothetical protein
MVSTRRKTLKIPESTLIDLKRRLEATPWPEREIGRAVLVDSGSKQKERWKECEEMKFNDWGEIV